MQLLNPRYSVALLQRHLFLQLLDVELVYLLLESMHSLLLEDLFLEFGQPFLLQLNYGFHLLVLSFEFLDLGRIRVISALLRVALLCLHVLQEVLFQLFATFQHTLLRFYVKFVR